MIDYKKEFLQIFSELCRTRHVWAVWEDLISAMACSLANALDHDWKCKQHQEREEEYAQCIKRLGGIEKPAMCFSVVVKALEDNPNQDFLGALYMELNLGNHWKGQFFTPYNICELMSNITAEDVENNIAEKGYIAVCDPACGAGATLIAFANRVKKTRYNFQNHVLFVGQDIDRVAGLMCFIQLSLLGCAGYICIDDTLSNPMTGHVLYPQKQEGQELWIMPMFRTRQWMWRRELYAFKRTEVQREAEKYDNKQFYMFFNFEEEKQ